MAKLTYQQMIVEVAWHIINHAAHGYSQPSREGDGTVETITLSDGTQVKIHGGDYDCSEMVRMCLAAVGLLAWGYWDSYMWTGNEREILLANGFVEVSLDDVRAGDILWVAGHTEIYLGDGLQGGARRSEYHSTHGEQGDQDGYEIAASGYDRWQWTSAYRCTRVREVPMPKPKQVAGNPKNDAGLKCQAHAQDLGWCDVVRDGQTAGTVGFGRRLEAIRFAEIPSGWTIYAKAHIQNVGWKDFGALKVGTIVGTTGKSQAIESLILDAKAPSGDKRKLWFQVHQGNLGWKGVTQQGYASGTDGMGIQLEAIRVWLQ